MPKIITQSFERNVWERHLEQSFLVQKLSIYEVESNEMCDRWKGSFESFLEDMGPKPGDWYIPVKADEYKPFCKENVSWRDLRTLRKRKKAKRGTKQLTYRGKTQSMKEWCQELDQLIWTVQQRVQSGNCSLEQALSKQSTRSRRR